MNLKDNINNFPTSVVPNSESCFGFTRHSFYKTNSNGNLPTGVTILDLRNQDSKEKPLFNKKQLRKDSTIQCYDNYVANLKDGCPGHEPFYYVPYANHHYFIPEVLQQFDYYMKEKHLCDTKLILQNKNDGSLYTKEMLTRYDGEYIDRIVTRAKFLACNYRNQSSVLLTLTVDPKKYDYDIIKMWEAMMGVNSEFNRFMTNLRKFNRLAGNPPLKYVATIEAMSGRKESNYIGLGLPHIHICFFGVSRLMDWRKLRDIWQNGHIWINRDSFGKKVRNPVDYVMKYVTKTYTDTNKKNKLTQSLTWFFNARMFNTSRGLVHPLKYPSSGDYEAVFLVSIPSGLPIKILTSIMSTINKKLSCG